MKHVALALALVVSMGAGGAAAAAGEAAAKVSIAPSDAGGRPIAGPGYFVLEAEAGSSFVGHVSVGNLTPAAAIVSLNAVDAATGPFGGVSYALPEQARERVGSWIELEATSLSVDPGHSAIVAFSVKVPADAMPGEHLGGIAAFVPLSAASSAEGGLQVQQRAIVAVQVNIPGPRAREMAVKGLAPQLRPDGVYAVAQLANSGNALIPAAAGSLLITRRDRSTALAAPLSLETTVPGSAAAYPLRWDPPPAAGRYHGHIELAWDGGSLIWDSDFDVDDTAARAAHPGSAAGGLLLGARADGSPLVALIAVAAGILLSGLLVIFLVARRKRRRRRGPASSAA